MMIKLMGNGNERNSLLLNEKESLYPQKSTNF